MSEEQHQAKGRPPRRTSPTADPKRPYHVGVAIGLTTGIYAASLFAAARLQIASDRELIEDRTPVEAAISALGDHHDWMDGRLEDARAQYAIGTTGYDALRARLAALDQRLSQLDKVVDRVEKIGATLPASLNLPALTTPRSSGGGTSSAGQSSSGGSKPKRLPAAPAAPPPPPATGGTTGASGAP